MSWKTFRDNLVSFGDNPDNISDIDKVAKKWADEYDAAIKRGGDTINKIKIQNGNKAIMEQLFKAALQKGLSSTAPYDLVGEMGKGVIAYWSGAIMQNVPIPIQLPPGATANVSVTSNVVLNPGQWTPPAPGATIDMEREEPTEFDIANDIDMPYVENMAADNPVTEEEILTEIEQLGNLEEFVEEIELNGIPALETTEAELISEPDVIDYDAGLPLPGLAVTETPTFVPSQEVQIESEFKAVLVGGLDDRKDKSGKLTDKTIAEQTTLFKQGFGNVEIKSFRYTTQTNEILTFLSENPKLPVFLFSKGCEKAEQFSKSPHVDNKNLFIIEPYAESANTKKLVENAIKNGVPASNVYAGPSSGRGNGIAGASNTPSGIDHWGALKYVGSQKASLAGQKFYKGSNRGNNSNNGGEPKIYSNVGKTAAGIPPGYEKYAKDRSHIKRPTAKKPDGSSGSIPYEALRKVNRGSYGSGYLHPEAAVALELLLDLCVELGTTFTISSWYRDYEKQVSLFTDPGTTPGGAATPGHSNHGWGRAIDISELYRKCAAVGKALGQVKTEGAVNAKVRQSDLFKFLATHAPKFGWYNPAALCDGNRTDEAWHWEYHGFTTLSTAQRNEMLKTFQSTPRKNPSSKRK